jgi:hypothetical protein
VLYLELYFLFHFALFCVNKTLSLFCFFCCGFMENVTKSFDIIKVLQKSFLLFIVCRSSYFICELMHVKCKPIIWIVWFCMRNKKKY